MRKRLEDPFNTTRRINETSYIIHSNSTNMFSETNIIELLKFLIDNFTCTGTITLSSAVDKKEVSLNHT
jgi:hypothetical protein